MFSLFLVKNFSKSVGSLMFQLMLILERVFSLKFTLGLVIVKGILGVELVCTQWAGVGKDVGKMDCFNVVPHTGGGFVGKLVTNATSWYVLVISHHVLIQI